MKKLLLFFTLSFSLFAQAPCVTTGSFSAVGTSLAIDNRKLGCYQWRVAYNSTGFSALSVQLEQAPDSGGVPGTWAAFTGATVVTDGSNPSTNTNAAIIGIHSGAAWVRLNLVSKTGVGVLSYQVWGANSTSSQAAITGTSPIVVAGNNVSCPTCGTGSGTVTAVTATPPLTSSGGTAPVISATYQGNGAKVQASTGSTVTNDCVKFDANGNTVDAGAACGTATLVLQTKGSPNGSQTLLNLAQGSNVTLSDNGTGTVTIAASGGGGGSGFTSQAVVTGSRVLGTVYQNSGMTTMFVTMSNFNTITNVAACAVFTDASNPPTTQVLQSTDGPYGVSFSVATCSFMVLAGNFYKVTNSGVSGNALNFWTEWN